MEARLVQYAEGRFSGWRPVPPPDGSSVTVIGFECWNCRGAGAFAQSWVDCHVCEGEGRV